MRIISYGDSHARTTFSDINEIQKIELHGRTMNRICKEGIGKELIGRLDTKNNFVIFCFGEIDIRCHVHKQITDHNRQLEEILGTLIDKYTDHILNHSNKYKYEPCIMSIVPACNITKIKDNPEYPCVGSNEQRSFYTIEKNKLIYEKCENHGIMYLDIHSRYVDENGLLKFEYSDHNVHIKDTSFVKDVLKEKNLIS